MAAAETMEPLTLIGTNALAYYLKRICTYLESDKKTLSFPRITSELQQLLIRIVAENPEFLSSEEFSNNARLEGAKLATAMKVHGNIKLRYEISDGMHGPNVLSYTKIEANPFKVPEPLRLPSEAKPSLMVSPDDTAVSPIFKTNCLNAATKFVKDDLQLVMRFPEMVAEQAEFVRNMILPGIEGKTDQTDVGFGYRSMYAPLWESMRVFSPKYKYKIDFDTKPVSKEGMKRVVFEKIPKCKKPDVVDVDNPDTLNNTFSSSSTTSISKSLSKPKANSQPVVSKRTSELILKLTEGIRCKSISEQFMDDALKRISDFLMDDGKKTTVFKQQTFMQLQFLERAYHFSHETDTYMLFSSECQRYLDNIKYCNNVKGVRYKTIRIKCIVEGVNVNLMDLVMEKVQKSPIPENQDVEVETISISSSSNISTSTKKPGHFVCKAVRKVQTKITSGVISQDFIETSLERMLSFIQDDQQGSIMFKKIDKFHQMFIMNIRRFCQCDPNKLSAFSNKSKRLLADVKNSLRANVDYSQRNCKGGLDVILEKSAVFSNKQPVKENKENVNTVNTSMPPHLLRLKHIKDNITRVSGEQAVTHYLNDLSNFLTRSNMDRSITFDAISETDCHFLKNVHVMSKTDNAYSMFSRECQKLLNNIRFNAQGYIIKCQTIEDVDNAGLWTVILEKQIISPKEKEIRTAASNIKYKKSIKSLYTACQKVMDRKDLIVQQRARSLSAGLRVPKSEAKKAEPITRSCSIQRPRNIKEKLQAALAQPVRPDKALKMMELMGWKGGALGPRGEGITEPIALPLDLATRAGLGHVKPAKTKPESKKSKPRPETAQPKREPPVSSTNSATSILSRLTMQDVKPIASLPSHLVPAGILPSGLPDKLPAKRKAIFLNKDYHIQILRGILEIVSKDIDTMCFVLAFEGKKQRRIVNFLMHVMNGCKSRVSELGVTAKLQHVYQQITDVLRQRKEIMLRAESVEKKTVTVRKTYLIPIQRSKKQNEFVLLEKSQLFIKTKDCKEILTDKNQEKTTNEIITIDDQDTITVEEITAFNEEITADNQDKSTFSNRQWYLPLNNYFSDIPNTTESKTAKVLPVLKELKLSKVTEEMDSTMTTDAKTTQEVDATKTQKNRRRRSVVVVTTQKVVTISAQEFDTTTTEDVDMSTMKKVRINTTEEVHTITEQKDDAIKMQKDDAVTTQKVDATTIIDVEMPTTNEIETTKTKDVDMSTTNEVETTATKDVDMSTTNEFEITTQVYMTAMEEVDTTSNLSDKTTVQEVETTKTQIVDMPSVQDVEIISTQVDLIPMEEVDTTSKVSDKTTVQEVETTLTQMRNDVDISAVQEVEIPTTHEVDIIISQEFDTKTKEIDTPAPQFVNTTTESTQCNDQSKKKEIPKSNERTRNTEKQNRGKSTKQNVTIPTMSRRRINCLNQQGITTDTADQLTTYTITQEFGTRKMEDCNINKMKQSNLTVTKSTSEHPMLFQCKSTKWKINRQQYIEAKLTNEELKEIPMPLVLLEKYSINNNDLTLNQNNAVKKEKLSVASRLVNAVKDSDNAIQKEHLDTTPKRYNIVPDIKNNFHSTSNNSLVMKNVPNNENTTSTSNVLLLPKEEPVMVTKDTAKTSVDKENMTLNVNKKISKDNNIVLPDNGVTDVTQNSKETAVYVIPIEYVQTTEKGPELIKVIQNDKDVTIQDKNKNNEKDTSNKTADVKQNDEQASKEDKNNETNEVNLNAQGLMNGLTDKIDENNDNANKDDEDDDCQIIYEDSLSTIVLNSEDEDLLLTSDEDIEKIRGLIVKKEKNSSEDKSEVKENVMENLAKTDSVAKDCEDIGEKSIQVINQYRKRTSVDFSPARRSPVTKKCKLLLNFKKICILPKNYPETEINIEKAREIQAAILKSINSKQMFPLLKCQGIQNGGLVYYCQDEKSLFFLEDLIKTIDDLKLTHEFDDAAKCVHKMAFRINSYIDEPASVVLSRLEMYNLGLYCTHWSVIKKEQYVDYSVIYVEIDETSFNYVCNANFVLYAGNDCARFTIVWD